MGCMGVCRFFAWLSEIVAWRVLHLDLKVDTIGLFAASGIEIKTNHGIKIVSRYGHMVIYNYYKNCCDCCKFLLRILVQSMWLST